VKCTELPLAYTTGWRYLELAIKYIICCSTYNMSAMSSVIEKVVENIVKSPEDARLYRGLELKNGMKVLLISDATTDKSAASLDVHIGIELAFIDSRLKLHHL